MRNKLIALFLATVFLCGLVPFAVFAEESERNLAFGLPYTIETGEPIDKTYGNLVLDGFEYNVDSGKLTDGQTAQPIKESDLWFRTYSGQSRVVTLDLGEVCCVSGVRGGFLEDRKNNIYAPRYIRVYYSADGENYQCVGEYIGKYSSSDEGENIRHPIEITPEESYAARYVKVEYSCYGVTYCDEIYVKGKRTLSGNEKKPVANIPKKEVYYAQEIAERRDMVKLYNGLWLKDPSVGILTQDELLPYVGYVNKNGEITGTMFDGAVILPCDGEYFSGGRLYKGENSQAHMEDFEFYLNQTFTTGQDLSALNKVAGEVYQTLNSDKKFGVFLSIPYPSKSNVAFGDINGDGVEEYCNSFEDRLAICKWYVDKCISMFEQSGFDNLQLCGFYWLDESIDYNYSDHEEQLLTRLNAYINGLKYETLCSFGYLASGFDSCEELGFGAGVMQAQMIENGFSNEMLHDYSKSIYNNRLGAELESGSVGAYLADDDQYLKLGHAYESYMYNGSKFGYSSALNLYEQDMAPGTIYEFCYADKSTPKGNYLRRLYDLTHGYINDTYNNLPPTVTVETDVEIVYGDNQITLDFLINDLDSYADDIVVEFPGQPQHGKVVASAGKNKLIYSVDNGFEGVDSFKVCVSDGFNRTEAIEVSVSVTKPETSEGSDKVSVSASPLPLGGKLELPSWLLLVLVILALIMIVVAVGTILKPKKKNK